MFNSFLSAFIFKDIAAAAVLDHNGARTLVPEPHSPHPLAASLSFPIYEMQMRPPIYLFVLVSSSPDKD